VRFLFGQKHKSETKFQSLMKKILQNAAVWLLLATLNAHLVTAHAQGTAFTYQGQLNDGSTPANGSYDLVFTLYTTNTAGIAIAGPATNSAVAVTNGIFTTLIDFGPAVFTGDSNWLEIAVRTNGGSSFTTLVPRQLVTPAPYAITAESANNLTGLAVQPNASNDAPNLIGGSSVNFVAGGVIGATIGGGGAANYSGSPYTNSITSSFSTVGGGYANTAGGYGIGSTVAGGSENTASGYNSTVAGGDGNSAIGAVESTVGGGAGNTASGHYEATVGGGLNNTASGNFATIPGGNQNVASSSYSFAAGQQAQATNLGAFVWADSQNAPFASINNDSFNVRAQGGVRFVTGGAGLTVDGPLNSDGAPDWQVPAGTAVPAQSNTSYLLTNLQSVTLTLPASPNVGDMIEVFEAGSGGWTIAQNATQSVVYNIVSASNNTWVQTGAPSKYWTSIACSADGTQIAAGTDSGGIYTSTNSGANWIKTSAPSSGWWAGIACSADGTKLASVVLGGGIYTSTNSGANWTSNSAPSEQWVGIACSSDGTKLAAVVLGGGIYTSTNSGTNWNLTSAPNESWTVIANSGNGTKLAAATDGGGIYSSTNSGANWIKTSAPGGSWFGLASSADGGKLAATADGNGIHTLSYFSTNWIKTSAISTNYWGAIASSADGGSLAATVNYGYIYTSADSGVSWVQTSAPSTAWSAIASSADGTKLVAVVGETTYSTAALGGIWTAGYGRVAVNTSTGTGGFLGGGQGSGVKLIYAGNGQFVIVNKQGSIYGE
jgi:hypothetical protein